MRLLDLDRESPKRIAVVGDAMTDVYVHGHLADCQDGYQKFVEESRVECSGGAANAADCLLHWRSQAALFGNMDSDGPVKTRYMIDGRVHFRHDLDRMTFSEEDRRRLFTELCDWAPHAVLVSDYDKGVLTPEFVRRVIDYANRAGVPVVADAKRAAATYAGALIKGNHVWCQKYYDRHFLTVETCGEALPHIMDNGTANFLLQKVRLSPIHCVNHVGAGDCFAAHLTLSLAHGLPLQEACAVAHSAGRVYVQHPHNRPPHPEEVRADVD